ncbi:MAG TPA: hypothetical protein VFS21_31810 [Roseiflexaceae bacterium]|nr:hypothetical protein [Roseiflexaceae bacterium]
MAPRFSRPRLITADDRQYRAFVAQIMATKDNQRPTRPPRPRELFGGEAETALRTWLGQHFTLSDRRIVEYFEHRGRSAIKKYRELDAVVLDSEKSVQVFEIKASQKAGSLRRASRQLHDTRAILGQLFARVTTTILLVDTGIPTAEQIPAIMAEPDAPPYPPPTLDEVLTNLPQVRLAANLAERPSDPELISLLRFSVEDIVAIAGAENLHLAWDEEEPEEEDEAVEEESPYAYSTEEQAPEEEEEGSLGAAFKQALQGKDKGRRR